MTEQERFANLLAADEAQRHAQNGELRTASALKTELPRNEGVPTCRSRMASKLFGGADPTLARCNPLSRAGAVGTKRDNAAWEAVSAAANADEAPTPTRRQPPEGRPFTSETAREAGKRSAALRAMRSEARDLPPSDEAIEIGLRRRAVESAKDAEVLLRWLQRPRQSPSGLGLDEMGEEELEGLYAGLLRLARLDEDELARLLSSS